MVELVVALGVMLLMFSIAGQVFNLTIKSTGQATALTEVSQLLRTVEQTLREDLTSVQPGKSLILIQGNPVNAYWTQEGKDSDGDSKPANGYPHVADPDREDANGNMIAPRADILMIFTAHPGKSFVIPGLSSNLQQVVYGHAELGEYEASTVSPPYVFQPGPTAFPLDPATQYPSPTAVSAVPAFGWHVARRSVLLIPNDDDNDPTTFPPELGDLSILRGAGDVVWDFDYDQRVLTPGSDPNERWDLPAIFFGTTNPIARSQLDLTPPASLADRLGAYMLPHCASFKVEWTLDPRSEFVDGRLDRSSEVFWFDPGDPNDPLASLREARDRARDQGLPQLQADYASLLEGLTFHPDGLPAYSLAYRFRGQTLQAKINGDTEGWPELGADGRPNLIVFGASRRNAGPDGVPGTGDDKIVPEDIFPSALRITIDVYDGNGRLGRPIRHVMVVPVGG